MRMCILVAKSVSPQGQAVGSFRKNLALYSPTGACPRIILNALAHRVTECDIHVPPFVYVGRAGLRL